MKHKNGFLAVFKKKSRSSVISSIHFHIGECQPLSQGELKTWKVKIIFRYRQTLWATIKIEAFLRSFSKKTNLGRQISRGSFLLVYKNILTTYLKNLAKKKMKDTLSPPPNQV